MNTFAAIMEKNLDEVWNQRDPQQRLTAIQSLYLGDATLYEMGAEISGHEAINDKVTELLNSLPPDFMFRKQHDGAVNGNMGRLLWGLGAEGQAPAQLGMDVVLFEDGRIRSLYVFLD